MPRITEVLQIIDPQGQRTEKWRLTSRADGGTPKGLCAHQHDSYDEAWNCVEAWEVAKKLSGDSL